MQRSVPHAPGSNSQSLGLSVKAASKDALYRQIFDQLAMRIQSGAFPAGFRLPPTRALAASLGTHRNTVVRAYEELEDAGFIESTVGRGSFVKRQGSIAAASATPVEARPLPWSALLSPGARAVSARRALRQRPAPSGKKLIDLTGMTPPPELMPCDLLARCMDHVLHHDGGKALAYSNPQGVPALRRIVAEDLARRGVPGAADDVLITTGSQQGLDLVTRTLCSPGDVVLTHGSTYAGALQMFDAAGARVIGLVSDEEGPDMEGLRRALQRRPKMLYLMPNHVNPTGACISEARRKAILEWAGDAQVAVIEDDYAADLDLDGIPLPPAMRAFDPNVIHVGTFSKRLIPALRLGYVLLPSGLLPHVLSLKHTTDLSTSRLMQLALVEFIRRGYFAAHLTRIATVYRSRRDAIAGALRKHLPPDVVWHRPLRGYSLWLRLPDDVNALVAHEECMARGVLVSPGSWFAAEEGGERGLRLTFGNVGEDDLIKAGARIGEAIAAARNTAAPRMTSNEI